MSLLHFSMSRGGAPVGGGSAPAAPSSLTATAVSASQINLAWTDNSSDETGFEVERSANGSTGWTNITTTAANATSYSNTGLSASTAYYYRVRAVNSYGNSSYTTTANDTTSASGVFFQPDFGAAATVNGMYDDWNTVGSIAVAFDNSVLRSGGSSKVIRIGYNADEDEWDGMVYFDQHGLSSGTTTLYTRKYVYFDSLWQNHWPVGLKTSRMFTAHQSISGPDYAYMSEKFIWQAYPLGRITGSISGTTLTVATTVWGGVFVGSRIVGTGVTAGTTITASLGGGQYTVSASQTVSAGTTIFICDGANSGGDPYADYVWGLNHATFNNDRVAQYSSGTNFGNGLPYIRTGHWYCLESWQVMNSADDVADGVLQCRVDGQVVINESIAWRSTTRGCPNGTAWRWMWFGGNISTTSNDNFPTGQTLYRREDGHYLSTTADWV